MDNITNFNLFRFGSTVQITTERILIQSLLLLLFFPLMTILLQPQTVRTSYNQPLKPVKHLLDFLQRKATVWLITE